MENDGTALHFPECFALSNYSKWLPTILGPLFGSFFFSTKFDGQRWFPELKKNLKVIFIIGLKKFVHKVLTATWKSIADLKGHLLVHFGEPIPTSTPGNHRAMCKYCCTPICGSMKATSNVSKLTDLLSVFF